MDQEFHILDSLGIINKEFMFELRLSSPFKTTFKKGKLFRF